MHLTCVPTYPFLPSKGRHFTTMEGSWPLLVSWLHFSPILRLAPSVLYLPPICTHTRNFNQSLSVGAFSLNYKQVQNSLKDIISNKLLSYNSISCLPASSQSLKSSLYLFPFLSDYFLSIYPSVLKKNWSFEFHQWFFSFKAKWPFLVFISLNLLCS